jgi:MFS family permease
LLASSIGGHLPLVLLIVAVLLWTDRQPGLVVAALALTVTLFYTSEGFNSVSWPDLLAKVIPDGTRGRFYAVAQLLSSVFSAGMGYLVNRILAHEGWRISGRWAFIFTGALLGLMGSVASMAFVREQAGQVTAEKLDIRKSLRRIMYLARSDRWLRRAVIVQLLAFTASATFSFFVIRAGQVLPAGRSMLGTFLILQSAGTAVAAVISGVLVDRVGSWATIRLAGAVEVAALIAAVIAGLIGVPLPFYLIAFFLLGYVNGSFWWSFSAYLMDIAPESDRPFYLATNGVLVSLTVFNPMIAGVLFETVLPEAIFGGAAVLAAVGLAVAWSLRKGYLVHRELVVTTAQNSAE